MTIRTLNAKSDDRSRCRAPERSAIPFPWNRVLLRGFEALGILLTLALLTFVVALIIEFWRLS